MFEWSGNIYYDKLYVNYRHAFTLYHDFLIRQDFPGSSDVFILGTCLK